MPRQPSYRELFAVRDLVEIADAPLDGASEPQWRRGRVIDITTRLHVQFPGQSGHMAYDRADYNKGKIRKVSRVTETGPLGYRAVIRSAACLLQPLT